MATALGLSLLWPAMAVAQGGADCADLSRQLARTWRADSLQAPRLALAYRDCACEGGSKGYEELRPAQADTLMRLFQIGIQSQPDLRAAWLRERALLALERRGSYPYKLRPWLLEAIEAAPEEAPAFFYEEAVGIALADYGAIRLSLNEAVAAWAIADRGLYRCELAMPKEGPRYADLRERLRLRARSGLPDCGQVLANFGEQLAAKVLVGASCETFLLLHELQGCDLPAHWANALEMVFASGPHPWVRRLAAEAAYNRGDFAGSREHSRLLLASAGDAHLQAADQLQLARSLAALKDYRGAKQAILAAQRLHPHWGEPQLALMDLYLEGAPACAGTEFDKKALYWLLCDLCRALLDADPGENYTAQANERLYAYRQRCPTPAEAAFRGLKPGDSYPLKCWMSTVAKVRMD